MLLCRQETVVFEHTEEILSLMGLFFTHLKFSAWALFPQGPRREHTLQPLPLCEIAMP